MLAKTFTLPAKGLLCNNCKGGYFSDGQLKVCAYLKRFRDEFEGQLGWQRTRYMAEVGADTSLCSVNYQTHIQDSGLATVEAVFRIKHTPYLKVCSLYVRITGGNEEEMLETVRKIVELKTSPQKK